MSAPLDPPSRPSSHDTVGQTTFKDRESKNRGKIWWSNAILFTAMHIFAVVGAIWLSPLSELDWKTGVVCFISWQLASFGITICYHRLYSHRAFTATLPLRIVLAWMGSMGFQGSIKWWVLRHRLHHRFTDSPIHDPYAATRGLWWSHCGWIFWKPVYPRMKLIERSDLESDPVVRFQHRHYIPIAVFSGLVLPALIAHFGWNDGLGGLVWGGAVARLLIWHTTFCINSLAHWTGLQPYTEEVTARGNYLLALLTSGEGNHNFHHAFPKDFRNGPHPADWDPTKWIIYFLHRFTPFVPSIARTPESAILKARAHVHTLEADRLIRDIPTADRVKEAHELPVWGKREVTRRHGEWISGAGREKRRRVLLIIEGFVVDVGGYLDDHPGGQQLLLSHCVAPLPSRPMLSTIDTAEHDSGYSSGSTTSLHLSTTARRSKSQSRSQAQTSSLLHDHSRASSPTSASSVSSISSVSSSDDLHSAGEEGKDWEVDADADGPVADAEREEEKEMEKGKETEIVLRDATRAFFGGMNNHSGAAKEMMRCLRLARLGD